jgi:hypothetical protein
MQPARQSIAFVSEYAEWDRACWAMGVLSISLRHGTVCFVLPRVAKKGAVYPLGCIVGVDCDLQAHVCSIIVTDNSVVSLLNITTSAMSLHLAALPQQIHRLQLAVDALTRSGNFLDLSLMLGVICSGHT